SRRIQLRPGPGRRPERGRPAALSAVADRHQPEALVAALDGLLGDGAHVTDVDLVVDHPRLERCGLLCQHRGARGGRGRADLRRQAEDLVSVLGVTLVVLLPAAVVYVRLCGHEYPRAGAVDARAPGA